jgi:hypothetical protein
VPKPAATTKRVSQPVGAWPSQIAKLASLAAVRCSRRTRARPARPHRPRQTEVGRACRELMLLVQPESARRGWRALLDRYEPGASRVWVIRRRFPNLGARHASSATRRGFRQRKADPSSRPIDRHVMDSPLHFARPSRSWAAHRVHRAGLDQCAGRQKVDRREVSCHVHALDRHGLVERFGAPDPGLLKPATGSARSRLG